jgi:predicted kinase
MKYYLEDIAEVAVKLAGLDMGIDKHLILITALPGVGKTTLAREFARQSNGIHFDIDEIKRVVVPEEIVTEGIDPPEYRYKYYAGAIRKLPDLFAQSSAGIVIMDETFHLQAFRNMWNDAAMKFNIRLHWIAAVCDEEIVKQRLKVGKDRENHILAGGGHHMYSLFKKAFEPVEGPHEVVDTGKDIVPQVQKIIKTVIITSNQTL